jgi:hypothetical protein
LKCSFRSLISTKILTPTVTYFGKNIFCSNLGSTFCIFLHIHKCTKSAMQRLKITKNVFCILITGTHSLCRKQWPICYF